MQSRAARAVTFWLIGVPLGSVAGRLIGRLLHHHHTRHP